MARPSKPASSLLRRVLISIALLLVALLLIDLWGWPFLRVPIESALARQLERPVRLASPFRLHLLGSSLRAQSGGVWIAAPQGFDEPHVVDAQGVRLSLRYEDLLALRRTGALRIAGLDVERLDARLVRRDDEVATWQVGDPKAAREGPPQPPPEVDRLAVREGRIELRDPLVEADLVATFSTEEGSADGQPRSHAQVEGSFRERPLEGELTTAGLLRLLARGEGLQPVPAKGRLDYGGVHAEFEGTVMDLFGTRNIQGTASAKGRSLAVLGELFGMVLPTTAPFSLRGEVRKDDQLWRATVSEARIGSSELGGRFAYDAGAEPPKLEGELNGRRFILADLGPAFGTRDEEGKPVRPPAGRALPDRPLDLPALKDMDAQVAVSIDHVDLGAAFAEPIAPFKAHLSVSAGRLALAEIDARTARGSLGGDISVDSREKVPLWHAALRWSNIRMEEWIGISEERAAEARREGRPEPPPYFTGMLNGRTNVTGHGHSTAQLLSSLDGEITLFVRKGSISHLVIELLGLDVAQGLGVVFSGDQPLPTECAVMQFTAAKGQLMPKVALIDTPVTSVLIDGTIDLGREALDLRLVARPKNVSPLTLRTPIRVRGSFVDPQAAPEAGPIAGRVLGALVLGIVNPLAAIIPFIDPGEEAESPCARALAELRS